MKLILSIIMMIFLFSCKKINKEKSDIDTSNKDVNISKAKLMAGAGRNTGNPVMEDEVATVKKQCYQS